jgi:peptidoglycan/xylan/chitin deacetylase (PgdA/CDA1 family)
LEISNAYGIPFTLFCTGHALLKECKGHKTVIKILRRNRRYNFQTGEHLWHGIDPASNYIECPEFYYGDLIEEAIKSSMDHEIASHSFSHIPYPLVDDETVERDLKASIEALQSYGLKPYSLAFPFNLIGKTHILPKHGIKIVRSGHKSIQNITCNNGLVMVKSNITDLSMKKRTLLSWYLHPIILYNNKAHNIFEKIIKYLVKREINFLTFRKLHTMLLSSDG